MTNTDGWQIWTQRSRPITIVSSEHSANSSCIHRPRVHSWQKHTYDAESFVVSAIIMVVAVIINQIMA